jgi:hypothetical protein
MSGPVFQTAWFLLAVVLGVVVFLGWAMKRQEKNYINHIAKAKTLYDDQLAATKRMADDSNQIRQHMLAELKAIKRLLGAWKK